MELAHRWSDRNLTRTELIIALLLLALLIGYFSHYMFLVFGKVEKSMVERTVNNINTAIHYHASFSLMRNDIVSFNQILHMNPMDLMANKLGKEDFINHQQNNSPININYIVSAPSNYGGAVIDDSDPILEASRWYYDQDDHFLFYNLNNSEYFTSDIDGPARLRYRVTLNYTDMNNDDVFDSSVDKFDSMSLQPIDAYEWSF